MVANLKLPTLGIPASLGAGGCQVIGYLIGQSGMLFQDDSCRRGFYDVDPFEQAHLVVYANNQRFLVSARQSTQ
jgi:hypothetical protein